jgi:hypothetical protein
MQYFDVLDRKKLVSPDPHFRLGDVNCAQSQVQVGIDLVNRAGLAVGQAGKALIVADE